MIEALGSGPSSLRTTRQMLEVLGSGPSSLRTTRQMLEILISDTIYRRASAETLNFTETITTYVDRNPHVYDTLIFLEHIPGEFYTTVSDSLVFTEIGTRTKNGDGTDSLSFVDSGTYFHAIQDFWPTGDYLTFTEVVEVECGNWKYVPQTLTFTETVNWLGPRYVDTQHYISFQESVWNSNVFRETISDVLTLTHWAGRPYNVTISDSLVFTEDGRRRIDAVDSLVFNELVLNGKGGPASTELIFHQDVILQGSFVRVVEDILNIGQSCTYYYITPCIDKQYHPFIGDSNVIGQPSAPSLSAPLVQGLPTNTHFQLSYPAHGGATDTVILRAPELDNRDRNAFNRVNRETRGGRLVVFADSNWAKVNTIACTFTGLTKTEINTLQEFILTHIGEEIQVIDWEGRGWYGVVIKPNDPATCDGRDKWSIGFEFEGIPIESYSPGLSLVFTDSASNVVLRRPIVSDSLVFNQETLYQVN
jgi:hypothetical protein